MEADKQHRQSSSTIPTQKVPHSHVPKMRKPDIWEVGWRLTTFQAENVPQSNFRPSVPSQRKREKHRKKLKTPKPRATRTETKRSGL